VSAFSVACHGVCELIYYIRRLACIEEFLVVYHEEHSIGKVSEGERVTFAGTKMNHYGRKIE